MAVVVLGLPTSAAASVAPFTADFDTGGFSQFKSGPQTGGPGASISIRRGRAYHGSRSAAASYAGGGANNYARAVQNINWGQGTDVWYGEAVYLPVGFKAAMQGQVALIRWDDYPSVQSGADKCGTNGGLVINGDDKQARIIDGTYGYPGCPGQNTLVGPFNIQEGQWNWFDIHQKISVTNGQAFTEVYMNGQLIGSSTNANQIANFPIQRLRYGLVAIAAGVQTTPLNLWFARPYIGTSRLGPLTNRAAVTPQPTIAITSPNAGITVGQPITIGANTSNITPAKVGFERPAFAPAAQPPSEQAERPAFAPAAQPPSEQAERPAFAPAAQPPSEQAERPASEQAERPAFAPAAHPPSEQAERPASAPAAPSRVRPR